MRVLGLVLLALLGGCAGGDDDPDGLPRVERIWECECKGTMFDALGVELVPRMEDRCDVRNPSDEDCACTATEHACDSRDGGT